MANGQIDVAAVEAALAEFKDPESGRGVTAMKQLSDIRIEGDRLSLTLSLTTHSAPLWDETQAAMEQLLKERFAKLSSVEVRRTVHERAPSKLGQIGLAVKSVIAVASGKGGVGKSTIAALIHRGGHGHAVYQSDHRARLTHLPLIGRWQIDQ